MASLQALPLSVRLFPAAAQKSPQIPTGREKTSCVRIDYHNAAVLPPFCTITSSRGWKTREVAGNPSLDPWLWRRFFALADLCGFITSSAWDQFSCRWLAAHFLVQPSRSLPDPLYSLWTLLVCDVTVFWLWAGSGDTLVCVSIAINYLAIKHQKPESPSPTIWSL